MSMVKPQVREKKDIDIASIRQIAAQYMDYVASGEYHEDNDWQHYIYETVISSCFDINDTPWDFIDTAANGSELITIDGKSYTEDEIKKVLNN